MGVWIGGAVVAIVESSLSSGKRAGFSDINRLAREMAGSVVLEWQYSTLLQFNMLRQAYTCSHSRLDSHIHYLWDASCMCAHLYKIKTLAFCFVKTMKICVIPTSVLHQGWLVVVLVLAFTRDRLFHNVSDMLTYESTCCTSQQVLLFSVLGSRPSCWLFNMDICRWAVAKGNQWSDWLKKLSAALVLKGYLFQPSSSSDSKYVTNLGLDNELMNSISC